MSDDFDIIDFDPDGYEPVPVIQGPPGADGEPGADGVPLPVVIATALIFG